MPNQQEILQKCSTYPQNDSNPSCQICDFNNYRRIIVCPHCYQWTCRKCFHQSYKSQRDLQQDWADIEGLNKPIGCIFCRQDIDYPLRGIFHNNFIKILTYKTNDYKQALKSAIPLDVIKNNSLFNTVILDYLKDSTPNMFIDLL